MCHALFLAAPIHLPLIAITEPPTFSVEELSDRMNPIRARFPNGWSIRYLGAETGCSCGFAGSTAERPGMSGLLAYLRSLPVGTPIHLYDRWEGDFDQSPDEDTTVSLTDFEQSEPLIQEGSYLRLTT